MLMALQEKQMIFEALKRALKIKKLTYKDLAKKVKISEPSVKRIFSTQDCTLDRLFEFCQALEVSLFDLIEAAQTISPPDYSISEETENFFAKNLNYFIFYRKISEDPDIQKIRDEEELEAKTLHKYLKKLEEL